MSSPATRRLATLALLAALASPAARADPVVVELFTSQGCSSCPPADALLRELAERSDVLPLAFHVTYWDRLGWRDTFGLEASVARQERRARQLGLRGLYTPQMVIGGRIDAVGSDRSRVGRAIAILSEADPPGPELRIEGDRVLIAGAAQGTVWLAAYDRAHEVAIERGENRGRTLHYANVVGAVIELGSFAGGQAEYDLPPDLRDRHHGIAVWLEAPSGPILAAASSLQ